MKPWSHLSHPLKLQLLYICEGIFHVILVVSLALSIPCGVAYYPPLDQRLALFFVCLLRIVHPWTKGYLYSLCVYFVLSTSVRKVSSNICVDTSYCPTLDERLAFFFVWLLRAFHHCICVTRLNLALSCFVLSTPGRKINFILCLDTSYCSPLDERLSLFFVCLLRIVHPWTKV